MYLLISRRFDGTECDELEDSTDDESLRLRMKRLFDFNFLKFIICVDFVSVLISDESEEAESFVVSLRLDFVLFFTNVGFLRGRRPSATLITLRSSSSLDSLFCVEFLSFSLTFWSLCFWFFNCNSSLDDLTDRLFSTSFELFNWFFSSMNTSIRRLSIMFLSGSHVLWSSSQPSHFIKKSFFPYNKKHILESEFKIVIEFLKAAILTLTFLVSRIRSAL